MKDTSLTDARVWDKQDPLRHHRAQFALPEGIIYLDGNSLGPLPHATRNHLARITAEQWGTGLIGSWEAAGWLAAPTRLGDKIALRLGAAPGEVVAVDNTSVNLFKIAAAALVLRPGRQTLLTEEGNFPTDRHVLEGLARLLPNTRLVAAPAGELAGHLGRDVAALLLCHVDYRTGARHNMRHWAQAAHAAGALSLWDLSHSVGAIPVHLHEAGADMAAGCGYKFLNGGPGAPAFLYIASHLQAEARSPIQGWIGHAAPFAFDDRYTPAPGIARFLTGTPAVLALAALEASLDVFLAADPQALWEKSARLFDLFAARAPAALQRLTPANPAERGSHISFAHPEAEAILARLKTQGIIADFRPPNILRFGLTPLYTSFEEIWLAAEALGKEHRALQAFA